MPSETEQNAKRTINNTESAWVRFLLALSLTRSPFFAVPTKNREYFVRCTRVVKPFFLLFSLVWKRRQQQHHERQAKPSKVLYVSCCLLLLLLFFVYVLDDRRFVQRMLFTPRPSQSVINTLQRVCNRVFLWMHSSKQSGQTEQKRDKCILILRGKSASKSGQPWWCTYKNIATFDERLDLVDHREWTSSESFSSFETIKQHQAHIYENYSSLHPAFMLWLRYWVQLHKLSAPLRLTRIHRQN